MWLATARKHCHISLLSYPKIECPSCLCLNEWVYIEEQIAASSKVSAFLSIVNRAESAKPIYHAKSSPVFGTGCSLHDPLIPLLHNIAYTSGYRDLRKKFLLFI